MTLFLCKCQTFQGYGNMPLMLLLEKPHHPFTITCFPKSGHKHSTQIFSTTPQRYKTIMTTAYHYILLEAEKLSYSFSLLYKISHSDTK